MARGRRLFSKEKALYSDLCTLSISLHIHGRKFFNFRGNKTNPCEINRPVFSSVVAVEQPTPKHAFVIASWWLFSCHCHFHYHCRAMFDDAYLFVLVVAQVSFSLPLPGNVRWCLFTCPCRCPIVNKGLMASTLSRSEHKLWPCLGRWQALLRENKQGKPGKLQASKTNHEQYHHILLHLNIARILKIFNVFFSATISWPCWTSSLSNCYFLVV